MISRHLGKIALTAAALAASAFGAGAQNYPAPGGANPVCQRLEAQLSAVERGSNDPGRAEQIRRYEEAANKQQMELDRTVAQSRRMGCERSGFSLFGGPPQQCEPINSQIQQMRANLDRILSDLQRLQGAGIDYERDGQRRAVLAALARNDCGPQYRSASQQPSSRGLFDTLFGSNSIFSRDNWQSSTYRTVCVRTCDGYYFPISFATTQNYLREDEQKCQRLCPAADVMLFSHRNPGEDMTQAVSAGGRLYTELPNAFRYRQEFNPACSCKKPGETWADALKHLDDRSTLERGDILVTEERAKAMAQPRDAQGRPLPNATGKNAAGAKAVDAQPPTAMPGDAASSEAPAPASAEPGKRTVRSVGPQIYPVR